MAQPVSSSRASAVFLLDQVLGERRLLAELIGSGALDRLSPPDRARAQRLAVETLRELPRADALLAPFLSREPAPTVRNALRLGTVELAHGGDPHGVVNDLVAMLGRNRRLHRQKGLVNAVLRKVAGAVQPAWDGMEVPRLRGWLRERLIKSYGNDAVRAIEAAHLAGAPLDLSLRAPAQAADWAARLGAELLPTGSLRLTGPAQVSDLPGFAEGAWWVQDAGAALAARLLAPQAGEKVLDLCAAPGGKTLQLAAAGAEVTALDSSVARLGRLHANLARTGLKARVLTGDLFDHAEGPYDAILLDAPCSATGTIRRHPDLPYVKSGRELRQLAPLQARMIDHALTLLAPGGRLVYCTCSLFPEEGEQQITRALARHEALRVEPADLPGVAPGWQSAEGGLRLRPDFWAERGGIDGFYIACLRFGDRPGSPDGS